MSFNQLTRYILFFVKLSFCLLLSFYSTAQAKRNTNDLKIWFTHPASNWNEALPVGNGRLGAMIFGGINSERL